MPHRPRRRHLAAVVLAALVAGGIATTALPAAADPSPPAAGAPDYLAQSLPGLRAGSTLTPVTFERFEHLLRSEGTFAFLIGGPADETTRATAQHIDAVAAQYGVSTVYTFDPRLDGDKVDIRSYGDASVANSAGAQLRALYTRLVADYLNKDTAPQFGTGTDPYLFVYDRDRRIGDAEDRIVASLGGAVTEQQLAAPAARAQYRQSVAAVFDSIAVGGRAQVDEVGQFDFFRAQVNGKHLNDYKGGAQFGGPILEASDGADFRLQSITYPELRALLASDADSTILFGGTWCHNTRAVVKDVNRAAREADVDTVYVFDLRLDGQSGNNLHIRDSASALSFLYGDLVRTSLPNLRTQYTLEGNSVAYFPGGDTTAASAKALKLQVPYLIRYDRDRTVAGQPAPIAKNWFRENANGTVTEYMTEWWWVAHIPAVARNGESEEARLARQSANWAFADEAVDGIDAFFADAAPPSPSPSPTATSTPTPSPTITPTPTPTVTPTPTSGPASSPRPSAVATASLAVSGALEPGGRITVSGSGLPASTPVRVELHSTPVVLGTATTSESGTFSLTAAVPASTAPGAHSIRLFVGGTEVSRLAVIVNGALAATGAPAVPALLAGLGATSVVAGAVVAAVAIRRRRVA